MTYEDAARIVRDFTAEIDDTVAKAFLHVHFKPNEYPTMYNATIPGELREALGVILDYAWRYDEYSK